MRPREYLPSSHIRGNGAPFGGAVGPEASVWGNGLFGAILSSRPPFKVSRSPLNQHSPILRALYERTERQHIRPKTRNDMLGIPMRDVGGGHSAAVHR